MSGTPLTGPMDASRINKTDEPAVCETADVLGCKALRLRSGLYEALLLPERGGNLISFSHTARKTYRFLRSPRPDQEQEFADKPSRYGIPVLFPPNRIDGGVFQAAGKTYRFPVNELNLNNHIHGLFVRSPWQVLECGTAGDEAYAEIGQRVDESHPAYELFPHRFEFRIRYSLTGAGLAQQIHIRNDGEEPMPCMLGFHTAFCFPFSADGRPEDYKVHVTIGSRWETDKRMLPTGKLLPLSGHDELVAGEGTSPFAKEWADYYTANPRRTEEGKWNNRMHLTDAKMKIRLVYEVGGPYKQWVIWNDSAAGDFICVEPQSCAVNGANLDIPAEESGLVLLQPGEVWEAESRLFAEFDIRENGIDDGQFER
ncbi:aldose 1-epimerase [Paenibacillus thalictri]|uniref:Aldose 1-epimerase n=1 Tax=Paenibacillus thalictri TaxID=2527873 RepID=A0A4Q9DLI3_9BACL|nr:aldose 1-epimerase [Paenibacillus thalictri]TBL73288.1 aldose 1-epimerase [Paenibacillus thalictri]